MREPADHPTPHAANRFMLLESQSTSSVKRRRARRASRVTTPPQNRVLSRRLPTQPPTEILLSIGRCSPRVAPFGPVGEDCVTVRLYQYG